MLRYTAGLAATGCAGLATFHLASAAADAVVHGAVAKLDESRAYFEVGSHDAATLATPKAWASGRDNMGGFAAPLVLVGSLADEFSQAFVNSEESRRESLSIFSDHRLRRDSESSVASSPQVDASFCAVRRLSGPQSPAEDRMHRRSTSSDSASVLSIPAGTQAEERACAHARPGASTTDESGLIAAAGLFLASLESIPHAASELERAALYSTLCDLCVPDVVFSDRSFGRADSLKGGVGVRHMVEAMTSAGSLSPLRCLDDVALEDGKVYVHFLKDRECEGGNGTDGHLLIITLDPKNRITSVMSCSA